MMRAPPARFISRSGGTTRWIRSSRTQRAIEHLFTIYKELEGKTTSMEGLGGPREARKAIQDSRKNYLASRQARQPQEETTLRES
jgi:hypothetical protein